MTIAEIHGKSPYVYSEDILTADVFMAFRYLPAEIGVVGFLRSVPGLGDRLPDGHGQSSCTIYFWPLGLHYGREPDVLLELTIGGRICHIIVEAKYSSGPSDGETVSVVEGRETVKLGNQLADELRDLQRGRYRVFRGNRRNRHLTLSSEASDRYLLYLTAHPIQPDAELERSKEFFLEAGGRLFWTSWYHVFDYMLRLKATPLDFPFRQIVEDLLVLLDLKRFSSFHGFETLPLLDVVKEDGSFWKEGPVTVALYTGVRYPPALLLTPKNGSFWRDYRDGDLDFTGVSAPSFTPENASGSFWMD